MDKRKKYYLIIDTETTNGFDDPIVYDIGGAVVDKNGKVYEKFSFVIYETFFGMKDLMKSAYYAEKIPNYLEQIEKGERKVVTYATARRKIHELTAKYSIEAIIVHNMRFDYRSTTKTQRYLTKSKYRWFLPYGVKMWDTLSMAQDTICKQKIYKIWCEENGYTTTNGRPKATAEILYRYIVNDNNFIESHTALEDVLIEKEIFVACMRQHKKMKKEAF